MFRGVAIKSFIFLLVIVEIIPIQFQNPSQNGDSIKRNSIEESQLNECLSVADRSDIGVCFGKELLNKLNDYDETESFSLATGVTFVRDEKVPRDIGSFLDKDPMDFRSIIEDASNLISKRSLRWDLGKVYPGLVMRIGPTLANGVLEFVIDPRNNDRSYQNGKLTTGRLLTRNLLLPFLLGIKFHIATLLPILLGLLLLASKKAFLLAKIALFAVTLFTTKGSFANFSNFSESNGFYENFVSPPTAPSSPDHHHHFGSGGYYGDHRHYNHHAHDHDDHDLRDHDHYYYSEKSDQSHPTLAPITPGELRDRLEKLFVTKKDNSNPREESKVVNGRNYPWTPISGG